MPSDIDCAKIDRWIAAAADNRLVETTRRGDFWHTQALEDGDVVYEETELGNDEPMMELLAAWCERRIKVELRPPVKTSAESLPGRGHTQRS